MSTRASSARGDVRIAISHRSVVSCLALAHYEPLASLVVNVQVPCLTLQLCSIRVSGCVRTVTPIRQMNTLRQCLCTFTDQQMSTCQAHTTLGTTLATRTNRFSSLSSTDTRPPVKHTRPQVPCMRSMCRTARTQRLTRTAQRRRDNNRP
jgi:hypothetical protein